MLFRSNKTGEH